MSAGLRAGLECVSSKPTPAPSAPAPSAPAPARTSTDRRDRPRRARFGGGAAGGKIGGGSGTVKGADSADALAASAPGGHPETGVCQAWWLIGTVPGSASSRRCRVSRSGIRAHFPPPPAGNAYEAQDHPPYQLIPMYGLPDTNDAHSALGIAEDVLKVLHWFAVTPTRPAQAVSHARHGGAPAPLPWLALATPRDCAGWVAGPLRRSPPRLLPPPAARQRQSPQVLREPPLAPLAVRSARDDTPPTRVRGRYGPPAPPAPRASARTPACRRCAPRARVRAATHRLPHALAPRPAFPSAGGGGARTGPGPAPPLPARAGGRARRGWRAAARDQAHQAVDRSVPRPIGSAPPQVAWAAAA